MANIPQVDDNAATITFRCPADWKREINKALIDAGKTTQQAAIEGLSHITGIPVPEQFQNENAA
jgi:hypothetical protein